MAIEGRLNLRTNNTSILQFLRYPLYIRIYTIKNNNPKILHEYKTLYNLAMQYVGMKVWLYNRYTPV